MEPWSTGLSRRTFARFLGTGLAAAFAPAVSAAAPVARRMAAHGLTALPGGLEEMVRLSANENPYGPSPAAFAAVRGAFDHAWRYPDEELAALAGEIAHLHGVAADQVILGAGSSEVLKLAAAAYTGPGRPAVVAEPTFESMAHYAAAAGGEAIKVALTADHRHDLARMATPGAGLVYICNPNNPTASFTPKAQVRAFVQALGEKTAVLVDEAYFHYATDPDYESVLPLVAAHPNLIVTRTFSKIHGMAGLRCGYAVAQKEAIQRLRFHQAFDSLNLMALVAARASLGDTAYLEKSRRLNAEVRGRVVAAVEAMGLPTIPSAANFLMIDLGREIQPVREALRVQKIDVGRVFPSMPTFLRVTVGTGRQMDRFLAALRQVMA